MSVNFEELLDKNLSTVTMKPGSLLTGIIIDILETHVIVHVGLKSEAAVAIQEFVNEKGKIDLKVGDEVQLFLEAIEDGHGNTRVSREKAIKQEVWNIEVSYDDLEAILESSFPDEGIDYDEEEQWLKALELCSQQMLSNYI